MTLRHRVVGTAGHIDHGKSSLVRALTGVDPDRLAEEKRRGITIELGFAELPLADGSTAALIDVPGHERLVRTMVAGATGVDVLLLVVAADAGVMPQTREHLEIAALLGVGELVVALTKLDRAPDLASVAAEEVRALLETTPHREAPIVPCSSVTGAGLDELRAALLAAIRRSEATPRPPGAAALPIDRAFTLRGIGVVVTGTLTRGEIARDAALELWPGPRGEGQLVRARTVQVFGREVERAEGGDRVALNLQGIDADQVAPGQLLAAPGSATVARVVDVELRAGRRPLPSGARGVLHAGTAYAEARLQLFDRDELAPGELGFGRLRLGAPLPAFAGARFVLRGFDRRVGPLAGGRLLDPAPAARRRSPELHRAALEALAQGGGRRAHARAIVALAAFAGPRGVERSGLPVRLGELERPVELAILEATKSGQALAIGSVVVTTAAVRALGERVLEIVRAFHAEHPFKTGVPRAELISHARVRPAIVERAIDDLVQAGRLVADADGVREARRAPQKLGAEHRARLVELLEGAGLEPPRIAELETSFGLDKKSLRDLLASMARAGEVVIVSDELGFGAGAYARARSILLEVLARDGELRTQAAKEALQISRKYLIPLLEHLDKTHVTVRVGEVRRRGGA